MTRELAMIVLGHVVPVLLAIVGIVTGKWKWAPVVWTIAVVLAALAALVQAVDAYARRTAEARVRAKVSAVIGFLADSVEKASKIEYDMRGNSAPDTPEKLKKYVDRIEAWRTATGGRLSHELPETGADRILYAATGKPGSSGMVYEYFRLTACRDALAAILASVDGFVRRSLDLTERPRSGAGATWAALIGAMCVAAGAALLVASVTALRTP